MAVGTDAHCRFSRVNRRFLRVLRDPLFPLYFLERNLKMLGAEKGFDRAARRRNAKLLGVVEERIRWFRELLNADGSVTGRSGNHSPPALRALDDGPDRSRIESYCDHCGLCCEICSGFPDFPDPHNPPDAWQFVFGQGLGFGHRFCPFLMHDRRANGSFCAIHRYRPNPCRIFEEDECRTVKTELSDELARTHGRPPRSSARVGRLVAGALKNGRRHRRLAHEE